MANTNAGRRDDGQRRAIEDVLRPTGRNSVLAFLTSVLQTAGEEAGRAWPHARRLRRAGSADRP